MCVCSAPFSVVRYADDREHAEPTDEQQHQESGPGMQLHREAAGRLGVHLHDSGQWGSAFPVSQITLFRRTCYLHLSGWGVGTGNMTPPTPPRQRTSLSVCCLQEEMTIVKIGMCVHGRTSMDCRCYLCVRHDRAVRYVAYSRIRPVDQHYSEFSYRRREIAK